MALEWGLINQISPHKEVLNNAVDMANTLASDPYVGAFVSDAPKASSWWMSSRTFDNGINDKIIKYYQDAINTVNSGQGLPADVLKNTEIGVQQVLQQNP